MADILTAEQQAAVENRGRSLLVSAAAGSGKTKVLVERLFSYVESGEANLDDFLIITYTRAAAAELRGKIAKVLGEKLQEDPLNAHLQRQLLRVYRADIKTVDAFCTALLRENCHLLREDARGHALRPDFRVLDENEAQLLRERVLARTLDEFYETMATARRSWPIPLARGGTTARSARWCSSCTESCRRSRTWTAGSRRRRSFGTICRRAWRIRSTGRCCFLWCGARRSTVPRCCAARLRRWRRIRPLRISMRRSFSAWRSNSRSSPCQRRRTGMRRRSAAWTFRA